VTHDELTKLIRTGNEFAGIKYAPDSHTFALRSVVELHKQKLDDVGRPVCSECTINLSWKHYPCPTIQAIEKELS
jgi:hypothetical protein